MSKKRNDESEEKQRQAEIQPAASRRNPNAGQFSALTPPISTDPGHEAMFCASWNIQMSVMKLLHFSTFGGTAISICCTRTDREPLYRTQHVTENNKAANGSTSMGREMGDRRDMAALARCVLSGLHRGHHWRQ